MPPGDSPLLPEPPPPRPAGRDAAIAAALRRFDGEPASAPEPRASKASPANSWTRHPQLGLALAASLVVIIGFPAAFIGAFFAGRLADLIGRRNTMMLAAALFLAGALVQGFAGSQIIFVIARICGGMAVRCRE